MTKGEIRRQILAVRDGLLPEERRRLDREIGEKVLSHPAYREAQIILAYAGYRSEVDTMPLIRQALTAGKIVFAPKVAGEEMEFWQILSVGDLHDGYRGIPEPEERMALPEWLQRQGETVCKAMMWMPGAVFDRERHRIGYGKGFYDRYLARLRSTAVCQADGRTGLHLTTAALAYACQIVMRIPSEAHDIRPDLVITEAALYGDT